MIYILIATCCGSDDRHVGAPHLFSYFGKNFHNHCDHP